MARQSAQASINRDHRLRICEGAREESATHFNDRPRGLAGHIVNCVLVAEPI